MMLTLGWPARALDENHQTALHWAAFHGNAEMVRELLRHYAPLDAQELEFKGTPVGWALYGSKNGWHRATGDYVGSVEALLAAGAKAPQLTDDLEASEEVVAALRRQVAPASLRYLQGAGGCSQSPLGRDLHWAGIPARARTVFVGKGTHTSRIFQF